MPRELGASIVGGNADDMVIPPRSVWRSEHTSGRRPVHTDESRAQNVGVTHEVSMKIPSARVRPRIWCGVRRSISTIVPPQRGHGHDAAGVAGSKGRGASA